MAYSILFISHERKMGGACHSLLELAKGLQDLGNHVTVVVLYRGCPVDRKFREMGIETFPCFFGWWQQPENWPYVFKLLFRLLHWLQWISVIRISGYVKKHKVDIIHTNTSVTDIGAQVAERTGCRHVWHFREYGKADYRLEYMYGREASLNYALRCSDMIIFISNALRESYSDLKDNQKVQIIYDGIVPKKLSREKKYVSLRKTREIDHIFTFLVTGNISPGKNQKLVVEAAQILVEQMKFDQHKFQIYFAGATTSLAESKRYMGEIEECIRRYRLDNIFFTGYVEDMISLRAKVDAEIVPSKSEAYGRVTLEAMLSHDLVIASDSGANVELLGNSENGLLFKNDDAFDLAMKMQQAMNDDNAECIERAYEYVFKVHSQEESYCKVQGIYEYIMKRK